MAAINVWSGTGSEIAPGSKIEAGGCGAVAALGAAPASSFVAEATADVEMSSKLTGPAGLARSSGVPRGGS
eukprot:7441201-Alexandrium_andersonii.AAC.1